MNAIQNSHASIRILTRSIAALVAAVGVFAPSPAHAATGDWNIDANATGWGTAGNWLGGIIPNATDDTANFLFDITAARTISLDGSRVLGVMNVGDPTTPSAYTFSANGQGGALIFDTSAGNANLTFTAASGGAANVFNVPLQLDDTLSIHALNTGTHVFNGNISGAGGLMFDAGGTHGSGVVNVVGQAILSGFNTFSGGLTIAETRVQSASQFALGTGTVTVNDGGQLFLTGAGFYSNNIVLNTTGWNETTHGALGALRSDGNSVLTGSVTLGATARLSGTGGTTLVNGVIGETGGSQNLEINRLISGGAAANSTWVINNTSTYTGRTIVYSGTLRIGDSGTTGSLGSTAGVDFGNGTLEFRRSDNVTINTAFTQLTGSIGGVAVAGGNFVHSGIGTLTLDNGNSAYLGTTTANGLNGKLVFGSGGAYNFGAAGVSAGAVAMTNGADIEFRTSSNVTLNGAVTGVDTNPGLQTFLTWAGSGTLTLGGAGNNAGNQLSITSGTVEMNKTGTALAFGGSNQIGAHINGGTLRIANGVATRQMWTNADVKLDSGTLDLNGRADGFDVLTGNGGTVTNSGVAPATLLLGENNSAVQIFNGAAYAANYGGVMQDGAGTLGLTKAGTGLQTLSGGNTYTGATTINGGTLSVTGSLAAAGAVLVNNAGTLSGTGSVGNVTMAVGSSLRPGATSLNDSTGTLTVGSLTVNGGTLAFNLGASNDLVTSPGAVNFAATSTLNYSFSAAPVTTTLITGASVGGTLPTLGVIPTTRSTIGLNFVGGNALELTVSGPSAKALAWTGQNGQTWNLNTTANFTAGGSETFFNLDSVSFGDLAFGRVVTLAAGLTPTTVTVNNSVGNDYVFQAGSIAGGGASLTKSGNGLLALNTANTFSGPVTITGGTLRAGNAAALGDANGQTFVSGGGTLDVNALNLGAEFVRISGAGVGGNGALVNNSPTAQTQALRFLALTGNATIGGVGRFDVRAPGANVGEILDLGGNTLTKVGPNLFYVVGAHITDGNIDVLGGQFGVALANAVVQGSGTISYGPGTRGIFFQTTGANITRNLVVNGAAFDTEATSAAVNSSINLLGNLDVVNAAGTLTLNGVISQTGGARSLTKGIGGAGTFNANNAVTLNGNNSFTGGITVNNGAVNLGGTNTVAGPVTLNGYQSGTGMVNSVLQVLSTLQVPATLGTPSGIALNAGTLRLNLAGNYTLPAVTMTNPISANNVINFNGITQGVTLTINSALGTSDAFNVLNLEQGTTNFASGANVTLNTLNVGLNSLAAGNVGTLNIMPGSNVTVRTFYLGEGAAGRTGFVNQTGGTVNVTGFDAGVDGSLQIGRFNGSGAYYNLSGGTLNVPTATTSIGVDGTNPSFNVSGGTANLYRLLVDGRGPGTAPIGGTFDLSGGEVAIGVGGLGNTGNGQTNLSGGRLSASAHTIWSSGMNLVNNTPVLDTRGNTVTATGGLFGPGGFTKEGGGTLILSNATSNAAGTIQLNAGNIYLSGALTSSAASSTVNVNDGTALILDGTGAGVVNGTVNVNSGGLLVGFGNGTTTGKAGTLAVAAGGDVRMGVGIGTLSANTVNAAGGTFRFDLNATDTTTGGTLNDLVAVTGGLNFTGSTITPSFSAAPVSGNTYTLFTSGALAGLPAVNAAALNSRLTYVVGSAGNNVTLNVTGATKALTWTGAANNTWDVNSTQNWADPAAEKFFQADSVTFDGTAPGTINLVGSIQPAAITVNSAADYTFSGGTIDAGALTKSGAGTLTLTSRNTFGGGTVIAGGTVAFANGGLSSGGIVMAGGTARWHGTNNEDISFRTVMLPATDAAFDTNGNDVTFAAALGSGSSGNLVKNGAGTLTLLANSTYTGSTTVNGGTLQMGAGGATGSVNNGPVTVNAGGKLAVFRSGLSIPFNNAVSGAGTLEFKGDGSALNGDYVIGGNNAGLSGALTVTNARLQLDNANDIGTAAVTLNPGGQLLMTAGTYNNALTMSGIGWGETALPGNLGALRFGGGATWAGPVTLAGNTRIHAHAATDTGFISGAIGGTGNLIKTSTMPAGGNIGGVITLSGTAPNTYSGTTIVDSGTLQLGKNPGVVAIPGAVQLGNLNSNQPNLRMLANEQFAPGAVITFVNAANNWGRFDLQGTTQTLAGIQGTTGGGVIQNERLQIAPFAGGTTAPGTLILNSTANYFYDGFLRDEDDGGVVFPLSLVKNGTGTQTLSRSVNRGNATMNYTGTTTVNDGTLKLVDLNAAGGVAFNSPLIINAPGVVELNSSIAFVTRWNYAKPITGNGTINKTGPGVFGFAGAAAQPMNFAGTINVLEGTFMNDNNATNWAGSTANVNVSAGAVLDSRADPMVFNSLNGAGIVTNSFGNGPNVFDNFTVGVADGSGTLTGPVTDGGTGPGEQRGGMHFIKAGIGTQVLAGTNTYSGTTTINAGVLRIGNGGGTGSLGGDAVFNNASLVINRSGVLAVHNPINGIGTLTKEGTGNLKLTGNSTYAGATTIAGGTVTLGGSQSLPVSAALWLDATDGATINTGGGGEIVSWTNKGTLGAIGDATAALGQEPSFVVAEPAMNNQPVIRFDAAGPNGIAPFDRLTNNLDFTAGNVTVIYAGRLNGGGVNQRILSGVNNNWLLGTWNGSQDRAYMNAWVTQSTANAGVDTLGHVYTATVTGGGEGQFFGNGVSRGTLAGTQGPAGLSLGGGFASGVGAAVTTEFSDADIGEVLVFTSVLSTDDRRAVEAYLARKWQGGATNILPSTTAVSLTASGAALDINGITQTVGSIAGVAGTTISLGDGNLTTGGDNSSTDFDGAFTGGGIITKAGSGEWTLGGASTNTGDVNVIGGSLLVTGSLSGSSVHVQSGATLGGSGIIAGLVDVAAGGILSPGDSPGTLTTDTLDISAAVTAIATASMIFEIGVGGDKVIVNPGTLTIGSGLLEFDDFAFSALPSLVPGTYTLFDSGTVISGSLGANLSGSFGLDFTGTLALADGGRDIVLTVVPEPGSAALLLGGLAMLAGCRRRRKD